MAYLELRKEGDHWETRGRAKLTHSLVYQATTAAGTISAMEKYGEISQREATAQSSKYATRCHRGVVIIALVCISARI